MGHSNQIGTIWQVGNSCYIPDISAIRKTHGSEQSFRKITLFALTL